MFGYGSRGGVPKDVAALTRLNWVHLPFTTRHFLSEFVSWASRRSNLECRRALGCGRGERIEAPQTGRAGPMTRKIFSSRSSKLATGLKRQTRRGLRLSI